MLSAGVVRHRSPTPHTNPIPYPPPLSNPDPTTRHPLPRYRPLVPWVYLRKQVLVGKTSAAVNNWSAWPSIRHRPPWLRAISGAWPRVPWGSGVLGNGWEGWGQGAGRVLTVLLNFTCYGPPRPRTVSQCRALRIAAPAVPGRHMATLAGGRHLARAPQARWDSISCLHFLLGGWGWKVAWWGGVGWSAERQDEGEMERELTRLEFPHAWQSDTFVFLLDDWTRAGRSVIILPLSFCRS